MCTFEDNRQLNQQNVMFMKLNKYIVYCIASLFIFLAGTTSTATAQSRKELEKEKQKIENEIRKLNKELSTTRKNKNLSNSQLKTLNKKIKQREKLIKNINSQLGILETQLVATGDSIQLLKNEIDTLKMEYAKVVQILYKEHGVLNKLTLTVDPLKFNKSYLRTKYYNAYSRYRKHQAQLIQNHQIELENTTFKLLTQKSKQQSLLSQEVKNKKSLASEKALKQRTIDNYKKQEKKLSNELKKKEKQAKQLQAQIQKIINEELAKARKANKTATPKENAEDMELSNDFLSNKGRLPWPTAKSTVIREYGRYKHKSGGENMNYGIELLTDRGAIVRSVFDGKVTRIATGPNGQKMVFIKHGNYITVYTNLENVSVKEGTEVATKQKLGTVHTNNENRAEFNFQIWGGKNAQVESQNPRIWLAK
jgi:septal ring factor EnvC (AmiA/AmiB activator)